MNIEFSHIDAFADRAFKGNPAAVCWLQEPISDSLMLAIAGEFNLSETAFIFQENERYRIRWFTPTVEVNLCGHATLAATHFLREKGLVQDGESIELDSRSGVLTVTIAGKDILLNFPAFRLRKDQHHPKLAELLGVSAIVEYNVAHDDIHALVELPSAQAVRDANPNFSAMKELLNREIIVTAKSDDSRYDFVSRFFAPGIGIDEDPVCGAAHCCMGPYWQPKLGKSKMVGYQTSKRGGVVSVQVDGDRIILGGQATTVFRSELDAKILKESAPS